MYASCRAVRAKRNPRASYQDSLSTPGKGAPPLLHTLGKSCQDLMNHALRDTPKPLAGTSLTTTLKRPHAKSVRTEGGRSSAWCL